MKLSKFLLLLGLFLLPQVSFALNDYNFEDEIHSVIKLSFATFIDEAHAVEGKLISAASKLFWGLCLIGIVFKGIELILREDGSIQRFFFVVVHMLIIIGIFEFLLSHGSEIGIAIIESLMQIPVGSDKTSPIDIFNRAMQLNAELSRFKGGGSDPEDLIFLLMQTFIIILIFLFTVNYAILYLSAYILCVAGIVVLGFGALSYTRDMAVNYLRVLLSLGLQLMVMILVCNTGLQAIEQMSSTLWAKGSNLTFNDLFLLLFMAMLFYAMSRTLPSLAGSLVTGGNVSLGEGRSAFYQAAAIAFAPIVATSSYLYKKVAR